MKSEVFRQIQENRLKFYLENRMIKSKRPESSTSQKFPSHKPMSSFKPKVNQSTRMFFAIAQAILRRTYREIKKPIDKLDKILKDANVEIKEQLTLFAAFFFGDDDLVIEILNSRNSRKSLQTSNPEILKKTRVTRFVIHFLNQMISRNPAKIKPQTFLLFANNTIKLNLGVMKNTHAKLRLASIAFRSWLL